MFVSIHEFRGVIFHHLVDHFVLLFFVVHHEQLSSESTTWYLHRHLMKEKQFVENCSHLLYDHLLVHQSMDLDGMIDRTEIHQLTMLILFAFSDYTPSCLLPLVSCSFPLAMVHASAKFHLVENDELVYFYR